VHGNFRTWLSIAVNLGFFSIPVYEHMPQVIINTLYYLDNVGHDTKLSHHIIFLVELVILAFLIKACLPFVKSIIPS